MKRKNRKSDRRNESPSDKGSGSRGKTDNEIIEGLFREKRALKRVTNPDPGQVESEFNDRSAGAVSDSKERRVHVKAAKPLSSKMSFKSKESGCWEDSFANLRGDPPKKSQIPVLLVLLANNELFLTCFKGRLLTASRSIRKRSWGSIRAEVMDAFYSIPTII